MTIYLECEDDPLWKKGIAHAKLTAGQDNSQKAHEIYGVGTVVTRVKDPLRSELFGRLGLRTFSPTKIGVALAHDAIFQAGA